MTNVRDFVTMRRALRTGLFIGTFIGMSACAVLPDSAAAKAAPSAIEAVRLR